MLPTWSWCNYHSGNNSNVQVEVQQIIQEVSAIHFS